MFGIISQNAVNKRKQAEKQSRENEEFFENLFSYANAPIIAWDPEFRITRFNHAFELLTGRSADEVIGKPLEILFPSDRVESSMELIRKTLAGERWEVVEINIKHRDGAVRTVLWNSATIFAPDGKTPMATIAQGQDITGRKKSEELLRESEEEYRTMIDNSSDLIWVLDTEGTFSFFNRKAEDVSGYRLKDWLGKSFAPLIPPFDVPRVEKIFQETMSGRHQQYEVDVMRNDGSLITLSISTAPIVKFGEVVGTVSFGRDITRQRAAENTLKQTRDYLDNLLNYANAPIIVWDPEFRITRFNHAFESLTGRSAAEVMGKPLEILFPSDRVESSMELIRKTLAGERWEVVEINIQHRDGEVRTVLWNSATIFAPDGKTPVATIAQGQDITERKKSEQFIKNILESVNEGFVVIDPQYRIISANRAYSETVKLPIEDIIGKQCYGLSHHLAKPCHEADQPCAVKFTFETGEHQKVLHTHYDKDGYPKFVEVKSYPIKDETGKIVSVIEVINDITEQRKLEAQLLHAQKMEVTGQLAGGIAHDFNNIISAIVGYGYVTLMKMAKDDPQRLNIEQMLKAADRAAQLTQSLLAFSRKQIMDRKSVDLNESIRRVEKLLNRVIGEDIEVRMALHESAINLLADSAQIEQVLMNLATNARDAMPDGGSLTIETTLTSLDQGYIIAHGYGKLGTYAMISATDTGVGMNEATRKRIFEPFFTTKEVGKGTGLGLAMVYGIIKQHDGFINVYSEPGMGTTFKIYLPVITSGPAGKEKAPETEYPRRGTETILLAEDDESLRKLTSIVLREFGYEVIEAVDGEDTVKKFMENKERIQLLLFDLIMPKMTGKEAYDEIRKITPDIKIIFSSGYPPLIVRQRVLLENNMPVIPKPISPADLLKKVRSVLNEEKTE